MPNFKSAKCEPSTGYRPPVTSTTAGQVLRSRGQVSLPDTLALNDIIELVPLPDGHVIVDVSLEPDQLDTNIVPTIELDVGLANAGGTDLVAGSLIIDGTTAAQDGGRAIMDQVTAPRLAATATTRNVAAKVMAAAATPAAGIMSCTLLYAPADAGE